MFGFRPDGKKVKGLDPVFRVIPNVMLERADAQVYFKQDIPLKNLDEYIDRKMAEGIRFSYMDIIYAAIVRIINDRPQLNRFAMHGTLYERKGIYVTLTIKKGLEDNSPETTVKIPFTGKENIFEVRDILQGEIEKNKNLSAENSTDKLAGALSLVPDFVLRWAVKFLWFLDKHGLMPKAIIDASPFHTTAFLTNVGSLGIDSIYHHLYNFGTTSMFFSMGKKKKSYIYEDDEVIQEKCITIAFVGDERICDGYYYASSFKQLSRYLKKPELLEGAVKDKENATI